MKRYKKIVLAGGSGQIGRALQRHFQDQADVIIVLSRSPEKQLGNIRFLQWDGKTVGAWAKEINGADMLVNLAGKNVNCRYNEKNKQEIFDSRTNSIEVLAKAVKTCEHPPKLWIQSASATIYRDSRDKAMTEEGGEVGEGFSVEVCKKWEKTFWDETAQFEKTRKVVLRISLVISEHDGVLPRLRNLVRFGLGGKQGDGKQMVSWIYDKDVARLVEWLANHTEVNGAFNCTSPVPITNTNFMKVIRQAYGMPIGLPSPAWLLEIGAMIIGTETELILKSRYVIPDRLQHLGFEFKFPSIESSLKDIKAS